MDFFGRVTMSVAAHRMEAKAVVKVATVAEDPSPRVRKPLVCGMVDQRHRPQVSKSHLVTKNGQADKVVRVDACWVWNGLAQSNQAAAQVGGLRLLMELEGGRPRASGGAGQEGQLPGPVSLPSDDLGERMSDCC